MALILIIPVLAASIWIIVSSFCAIFRGEVNPAWKQRVSLLVGIGFAVGVWLAFYFHKEVPDRIRFDGFPVPTEVHIFAKETGEWRNTSPPELFQWLGKISNFIAGIALALLPVQIAIFLGKFKAASEKKT